MTSNERMTDLQKNIALVAHVKKELNDRGANLLSLCLSGSDLYGFSSNDSDYDVRGTFAYKTFKLLGLSKPNDVIEIKNFGKEFDIVLFEVSKEIGLALKGNCTTLEHFSAISDSAKFYYSTSEFLELKELILSSVGKSGVHQSYKGLAAFNFKKFIAHARRNTVKKYLYVFRGLLADIYFLQTNQIEPSIETLNSYFKIGTVKKLIELKRSKRENDSLPTEMDTGQIETELNELFIRADKAYVKSTLPTEALIEDRVLIEKWLLELRRKYLEE